MIGYLSGKLLSKQPPELLLEVAGVGYELLAPMATFYVLPAVGQNVSLYTHLSVSENAHTLYGFSELQSRTLFRTLIKVSGVGPKLALTILSGTSVTEFADSIAQNDTDALVRLPGIGKKTAQRLIIEMKDPLAKLELAGTSSAANEGAAAGSSREAFSALQALGYKDAEIRRLLKSVTDEELSTEEIIRQALRNSTA